MSDVVLYVKLESWVNIVREKLCGKELRLRVGIIILQVTNSFSIHKLINYLHMCYKIICPK